MQTARHQEQSDGNAFAAGFGEQDPPAFLSAERGAASQQNQGEEKASRDARAGMRRPGGFIFQEQDVQMGKRSARAKKQFRDSNSDAFQLHAIPGGWDPID